MDTPLLIFLHGAGQSPPVWQDVVGAINPTQPMVAPWLKGLKPTDHGGFDADQAVEAIADVMEVRGVARADLVGHSLGGLVALRFAATYPEKVAHLVLISTVLVPSVKDIARQRRVVRLTPAGLFRGVGKEQVLAALDALSELGLAVDLTQVKAPTLSVVAEGDAAGRASADLIVRDMHARAEVLDVPASDLLATQPARLAQLVMDFCADYL